METVYLETTIISYLASEPSRDLIVAGHQQITHEWWTRRRELFACSISQEVLDEISRGNPDQVARRLVIAQTLPKLPIGPAVSELATEFVRAGILPRNAASDAVHLAVAAVANTDYVLTWNCRHFANAQLLKQLDPVCTRSGYRLPTVCTPEELLGGDANV
jgi:predicted nucleic acid-binding protein